MNYIERLRTRPQDIAVFVEDEMTNMVGTNGILGLMKQKRLIS